MSKRDVIAVYPKAYAARSVGGDWWIWSPDVKGALNDVKGFPVYSPKKAWADALRELAIIKAGK